MNNTTPSTISSQVVNNLGTTRIKKTALDTLLYLQPHWDYKETHNHKNRYVGPCPFYSHENDGSRRGWAFSIADNKNAFICFKCGTKGFGSKRMGELLGTLPTYTSRPSTQHSPNSTPQKPRDPGPTKPQGVTIADLTREKGIDSDDVQEMYQWQDVPNPYHPDKPAVAIPYYDEDGKTVVRWRYRVSLNGNPKYIWDKQDNGKLLIPYGLNQLKWIRERHGYVIFVEGETDTVNLQRLGFPAIGLPGASTWKTEYKHYFEGLEVLAWQEPGKGGQEFVRRLAQDFPDLLVITPPQGVKDPTDLLLRLGPEGCKEAMRKLVEDPGPAVGLKEDTPSSSWHNITDPIIPNLTKDGKALIKRGLRPMYLKKDMDEYKRFILCGLCKRPVEWLGGHIEGRRYMCGLPLCPDCRYYRFKTYLKEKGEYFKPILNTPTVYDIQIGMRRIGNDKALLEERYIEVLGFTLKLMQAYKKKYGRRRGSEVASNHLYVRWLRVQNGTLWVCISMLANYDSGVETDLRELCLSLTGVEPLIEITRCDGEKGIDRALDLMAQRATGVFIWDTNDHLETYLMASKGKKLFQGVGYFYKVTGNGTLKVEKGHEEEVESGVNPFTGNYESYRRLGWVSPNEDWEAVFSEYTGRWHYRPKYPIEQMTKVDLESTSLEEALQRLRIKEDG